MNVCLGQIISGTRDFVFARVEEPGVCLTITPGTRLNILHKMRQKWEFWDENRLTFGHLTINIISYSIFMTLQNMRPWQGHCSGVRGGRTGPWAGQGPRGHGGLGVARELLHPGASPRLAHQILPGQAHQDQTRQVDRQHREDHFWGRRHTREWWRTKHSIFQFIDVWRVWERVPVPRADWTFPLGHPGPQKVKARNKILFIHPSPSGIRLYFPWTRPASWVYTFTPLHHLTNMAFFFLYVIFDS